MTYTISDYNSVQVLAVRGLSNELDQRSILQDVQRRLEQGSKSFVIDLSAEEIMNSVGLNFLLQMYNKSKKSGGQLALVNASDQVVQLLRVTKLNDIFPQANSVEEAVAVLS